VDNEGFMTLREVAVFLRRSPEAVYQSRSRGLGPRGRKIGRALLFRREEVEKWADQFMEHQPEPERGARRKKAAAA
jgi:predicted DNA-binding transcriptional regulator AlpA